jgi:hypothetical protein
MSQLSFEIARAFDSVASVSASLGVRDPSSAPVFTWKNQQYNAISAIQGEAEIFGAGGLTPDFHLTLTVKFSVFTGETPHPKQSLTYNSRAYKIQIVDSTPDGSGIIIKCNDPNRGAGIIEREH